MPALGSSASSLLGQQRTSATLLALTHPYGQTPSRPALWPHPAPKPGPTTTPSRALSPPQSNPPGSPQSPRTRGPSPTGPGPGPDANPARPPAPASCPSAPPHRPSAPNPRPRDAARLLLGKGLCRIPAAELGVRRCSHSRSSNRVPALPPPAGLELRSLRFPPRPLLPPHSEAHPLRPTRFSNQRSETVAVAGCHLIDSRKSPMAECASSSFSRFPKTGMVHGPMGV